MRARGVPSGGHVEGLDDARTMHGNRRVPARRGWGVRSATFSALLGGEFNEPEGVEVLVEPFMIHQFGMSAGFHEAPFVENEDAIGSLNRRQAVGDDKGCSAFHELFQCLLDESFRLTVEG
jgi:hypothetical protein